MVETSIGMTEQSNGSIEGLYATRNVTIEARPTRDKPVDPDEFATSVKDRILDLNNDFYVGTKLQNAFEQFGNTYNECVRLNREGEAYALVVPSSTGSGKSVSARLYFASIAKLGLTGLLVVSEVATAIEATVEINELAGKTIAGTHYSISDRNPANDLRCELEELPQIAVITHSLFIQRSDSGKEIDLLKKYRGKQRDCIIIDERIDLIKRVSFSTDEIPDAIAVLQRNDRFADMVIGLTNMNEVIYQNSRAVNGTARYIDEFKEIARQSGKDFQDTAELIEAGAYNLKPRMRGKKGDGNEEAKAVANLLRRIAFTTDGRYSHTKEGSRIVCHREEDLSGAFGSCVVLDATATINPEYKMRSTNNKPVKFFQRVQARNYQNVKLNICKAKGLSQSRSAITTVQVDDYLKIIGDALFMSNDKMLVVTYKNLVPLFKERCQYDNVEFIHWGGKDARGSNEFSNYNKAMAIGWFRKPQHVYIASVMAINDFENYSSITGSIWSDANHLKDRLIADDMLQFFNRIRCRVAIDEAGNCNPVELYMFTGGNHRLDSIITSSVKEEMPGIEISPWIISPVKSMKRKPTKVEIRADNVIEYLRGNIDKYEYIDQKTVIDYFRFSRQAMNRLLDLEYFNIQLEDENIYVTRTQTRGNPVRFILPTSKQQDVKLEIDTLHLVL